MLLFNSCTMAHTQKFETGFIINNLGYNKKMTLNGLRFLGQFNLKTDI